MVRWFAIALCTGCLMAQEPVPAPPASGTRVQASGSDQVSAGQGTAGHESAEQKATSASAAPVLLKTDEFPLNRFKEFSAIMVGSLMPNDERERHIYRSGDMFRAETLQGLGYMITDLAKLETYGMARTGCIVDGHPYLADFPFTEGRPGRKLESVLGGKETVDGHVCQIEDVTLSGGGLPQPMYLRFWEAEDMNGFPIKVQVMKGPHSVIKYKNVSVGPQDPTLFMHPNYCKGGLPKLPAKTPTISPKPKTSPPSTSKDESHN